MSEKRDAISGNTSELTSRKKKKEKKRKRHHEDGQGDLDENIDESTSTEKENEGKENLVVDTKEGEKKETNCNDDNKESRRFAKKEERSQKRREKEELLEKVPKADENGIAYTKLQIKRMLKRVKRGLAPVPTEEEERDRLRREAELRREEEAELAGMIYKKEDTDEESETHEEHSDQEEENDDNLDAEDHSNEETNKGNDSHDLNAGEDHTTPPQKKSKRAKPVPPDYVCQACKNRNTPSHWIYDCPEKKTVKGINLKKKKERGLHQPDSRKVFVSGLPFDVKPADVQQLFQSSGKVVSCKLVKFGDTGRCNGQAYVSFDSDEAATKALKLSGTTIDNTKEDKKAKSKGTDASTPKRQQLKLKISRVLNRRMTKTTSKPKSSS